MHGLRRWLQAGRGCAMQGYGDGRAGFGVAGLFCRDGVGWHRHQPGGLLDQGLYKDEERFSEELG